VLPQARKVVNWLSRPIFQIQLIPSAAKKSEGRFASRMPSQAIPGHSGNPEIAAKLTLVKRQDSS
jgi:hypothetical protein